MKKFCLSLLLVLSLVMGPMLCEAGQALHTSAYESVESKTSHNNDGDNDGGTITADHHCCSQHSQTDNFIPKEASLIINTKESSFPLPGHNFSRSIITGPLLEPPAA